MLMAFISLLVYQQFLLHSRGSGSKANLCECLPVSGGQDGARAGVKGQRERERERERERGRLYHSCDLNESLPSYLWGPGTSTSLSAAYFPKV